jgi:uncharacterized alkaline shock family protein YloU
MAESAATSTPDAVQSGDVSNRPARTSGAPPQRSELVTDAGKTSIADTVVAKIAGLAAREVSGVHEMGGGMSRTFGSIKDRLPIGSSDPSPTRGVSVEVGERQAAVDLDVVVEYGAAIVDVATAIRSNVIGKVEAMTGLEVTEVNVTVDDVYLGEPQSDQEPRVQ